VHREVYADAAAYFDPYSTAELVGTLRRVLYAEGAAGVQEDLRRRGQEVSARYLPAQVLPQWDGFLSRVYASRGEPLGSLGAVAQPAIEPVATPEET
jgi:hypothetical protein